MIWISAYNRYHAPSGRYVRVDPPPKGEPPPRPMPPRTTPVTPRQSGLSALLPAGLDTGDLLLAALLLFLYLESRDEDFLVILLVVGSSMLGEKGLSLPGGAG